MPLRGQQEFKLLNFVKWPNSIWNGKWNFHYRDATYNILRGGTEKARKMDFHFGYCCVNKTLNFLGAARAKHGMWISLFWFFKVQSAKIKNYVYCHIVLWGRKEKTWETDGRAEVCGSKFADRLLRTEVCGPTYKRKKNFSNRQSGEGEFIQ
jgi:hypothetical protein